MGGANLEWVEQSWCGWSKFGVGGANLECGQNSADNLEMMLIVSVLFLANCYRVIH